MIPTSNILCMNHGGGGVVQFKVIQDQAGACLLLEELSRQRPPALTSADRAVLAT